MILIDTGPIVALLDRRDGDHGRCRAAAARHPSQPFGTTWPCFVEAMHLLGRRVGHQGQASLWALRNSVRLSIHAPSDDEVDRMAELMDRYRDLPMDLADASLVAAAERFSLRTLFTLDGDFRVYRLADGSTLDLVPGGAA